MSKTEPIDVTKELSCADRGCQEPVVVTAVDKDTFLLQVEGEYLDLELSRREARGLHACLDAALAGS
jgi:hypothetical protein